MAGPDKLQFVRFSAYRQGAPSKRHTVGSILAEGLRHPTHISHLPGAPRFNVVPLGDSVSDPEDLGRWIHEEMAAARNTMQMQGRIVERRVRSDALAIGTMIASLPETMADFDPERYASFCEDTTEWARDFLSSRDYMLHFRLEHLDELHPHMHLWFTPKERGEREGNWSFNNLFGDTSKSFYHNLLKNFYENVGHQYFDRRARPVGERQKRMPRHFAIQQRSEADRDVLRNMQGDRGDSAPSFPSRDSINDALKKMPDNDLGDIPVIRNFAASQSQQTSFDLERIKQENEALSREIAELRQGRVSLEEEKNSLRHDLSSHGHELSQLRNEISALKTQNDQYKKLIDERQNGAGEARKALDAFYTGASEFLSRGLWDHIVQSVLESAHNNANRAFHVSQQDWEGLVIDDALSNMMPESDSPYIEDVEHWLGEAVRGLYNSKLQGASDASFEAFSQGQSQSRSGVPMPAPGEARFRRFASGPEASPQTLWPSR